MEIKLQSFFYLLFFLIIILVIYILTKRNRCPESFKAKKKKIKRFPKKIKGIAYI